MRRHISEGTLRAFCDHALSTEEHVRVQQHLNTCRSCAEKASVVRARAERIHALFSELEYGDSAARITPQLAHSLLSAHEHDRKERYMARNRFSGRFRLAWAIAALALLTAIALTVTPVRTLAGNLLGIFRVQRIAFTPVDSAAFPDEETLEALAPEIERMFGDTLAVMAESKPERMHEAAAREHAGFPIRLPRASEATRHEWTAPIHVTMDIDRERLQTLFAELGYQEIELPRSLAGKTVEADFSGMLTSYYGTCEEEPIEEGCITFVQMASPTVTVPDGLDVEHLGRVYLELLGTPAADAARLSQQIDWTTTLVLPFPHHVHLTYETVRVDGVQATLVHSESGYRPTPEYLLTWVKDNVIYALAGKGDHAEALTLVTSLR